jgi:hypothetical protein
MTDNRISCEGCGAHLAGGEPHAINNCPGTVQNALAIPESVWQADSDYLGNGDPAQRLRASILLNGVQMYLEAYAVDKPDPKFPDELHVVDPDLDAFLDSLVGDAAYPLATHRIRGREYVVIGVPGSR